MASAVEKLATAEAAAQAMDVGTTRVAAPIIKKGYLVPTGALANCGGAAVAVSSDVLVPAGAHYCPSSYDRPTALKVFELVMDVLPGEALAITGMMMHRPVPQLRHILSRGHTKNMIEVMNAFLNQLEGGDKALACSASCDQYRRHYL